MFFSLFFKDSLLYSSKSNDKNIWLFHYQKAVKKTKSTAISYVEKDNKDLKDLLISPLQFFASNSYESGNFWEAKVFVLMIDILPRLRSETAIFRERM